MPYFRPDSERYGRFDKAEELEHAEMPPDREPREGDVGQTDIRRWLSSLDQASRMFGRHHGPDAVSENPKRKIEIVPDEELETLEREIEGRDE